MLVISPDHRMSNYFVTHIWQYRKVSCLATWLLRVFSSISILNDVTVTPLYNRLSASTNVMPRRSLHSTPMASP